MRWICGRHGLPAGSLVRQPPGTHVVFRTGDLVVKLSCPLYLGTPPDAERRVLEHLAGFPCPKLVAHGELEGWPYLVETVLPGIPAADAWDSLVPAERASIVRQLGALMRRLHEQPPLEGLAVDWPAFRAERIANALEHHGVTGAWAAWLADRLRVFREAPAPPVLLHADITADHVLLESTGGRWNVAGLIDFCDARMGHPHYGFVAPRVCFAAGSGELADILVESAGEHPTALLRDQLLTGCFIHRFAKLGDITVRTGATNPDDFERAFWDAAERDAP